MGAGLSRIVAGIDRLALFSALFVALTVHALSARFLLALRVQPLSALGSLLGISVIVWLALAAVAGIAAANRAGTEWRRGDALCAAPLALAALLPFTLAAALGLAVGAGYFAWRSQAGTPERRVALIALALTIPTLWGVVVLAVLVREIATVESFLIGHVAQLPVQGNVIVASDGRTTFIVGGACSALANLSLVAVCVVTASQWFQLRNWRVMALAGGAIAVLVLAINLVRLSLLGHHPQQLVFWHDGFGAVLFGNLTLAVMLVITAWGVQVAARRAS